MRIIQRITVLLSAEEIDRILIAHVANVPYVGDPPFVRWTCNGGDKPTAVVEYVSNDLDKPVN